LGSEAEGRLSNDLECRTREFSIALIAAVETLDRGPVANHLVRQLLRAGTAIGANYREARRAESRRDFIHKLGIAEKEASESCYWLELINESGKGDSATRALEQEAGELLAILVACGRTARRSSNNSDRRAQGPKPAPV
jgi:four helix bundle protein